MDRLSSCFLGLLLALTVAIDPARGGDTWTVLPQSEFLPDAYQDGDSFWLKTRKPGAKRSYSYIFRLYGADCPESTASQEPARILEQAEAFRLPPADIPRWGKVAAAFTARVLAEAKTITVTTRKTEAGGQSARNRYYAFVEVDGRDLAEMLIEAGLARAHGFTDDYDGRSADQYRRLLERAERTARRERAGLWREAALPR
jgi:endonuclease YncB( thermonuclease family)